ncbi:MAG: hypothetical protein QW770_04985, partial [Candidatus Bathyarchaeia archaeon]
RSNTPNTYIQKTPKKQNRTRKPLGISQRELKATFSIIRIRAAGLKESHKENLMVRCFWVVILRRGVIAFKIF